MTPARAAYEARMVGQRCTPWDELSDEAREVWKRVADAAMVWQPVETAPRGREPILVWNGTSMHTAVFDRVDSGWRLIPKTTVKTITVPGVVTHWMPLPAPPKRAAHYRGPCLDGQSG